MTGNSIGDRAPPQQNAPQSTGNAAPNQVASLGAGALRFVNEKARDASLNKTLAAWEKRVNRSGDLKNFDKLSKVSTKVRRNQGAVIGSHGIDEEFTAEEVKEHFNQESNTAVADVKRKLFAALGKTDEVAKSLHSKYENAIATLRQYSGGSENASLTDAQARMRGFTNLKLFVAYGGDLHSTRGGKNKLTRTIAKIPKKVLENASEEVTFEDYAKADHLKWEGRKRRLLSFHIGFKARWSLFGKGKHSRAYRENLRAITASALLLGGFEKAVKVKEYLSRINSLPTLADGASKEEMVQNVLDRLGTHGDLNALMKDLIFELQRHQLLDAYDSMYNRTFANTFEKDFYQTVSYKLSKLDRLPNRTIIVQNIAKKAEKDEKGYRAYEAAIPYNVQRDLTGATEKNPIQYFFNLRDNKAKAAQSAIVDWLEVMIHKESKARTTIDNEILRINQTKGKNNRNTIYLNAVRSFAGIDKRNISVNDQCVLLLICLRHPFANAGEHLKKLESLKAGNRKNKPGIPNKNEPNPLHAPSNADTNEKMDIEQYVKPNKKIKERFEIKDDPKYGKAENQNDKPGIPNKDEPKPPHGPSKADVNIRDDKDQDVRSNENKDLRIKDDIGNIGDFSNQRLADLSEKGLTVFFKQRDNFLKQRTKPISEEPGDSRAEDPRDIEIDSEIEEARQKPQGSSGGGDEWKELPTTEFEDIKTDISDDKPGGSDKADDSGDSSDISNDPEKTDGLPSDMSGKKDV